MFGKRTLMFGILCYCLLPILDLAEANCPSHEFNVVSGLFKRIDCAKYACSVAGGGTGYVHASADVDYAGVHHLFMCSTGDSGSLDNMRYIRDQDPEKGILRIVLRPVLGGKDMAACDPNVVLFNGYFYLFYGSAIMTSSDPKDNVNVIHVARSEKLDAHSDEWEILDEDGSWRPNTPNPKHIIKPFHPERTQRAGYLGASFPSAVVMNDQVLLWYMDDTAATAPRVFSYYKTSSTDVEHLSAPVSTNLSGHSLEIKFDPAKNHFVAFGVQNPHKPGSWLSVQSSDPSGIQWSAPDNIYLLPDYSNNVTVEGDEKGYLVNRPFRINFAAPYGLDPVFDVQKSWGHWDLFMILVSSQPQ